MRRRATTFERLTRHKTASWYRTRTAEGAPGSPEASNVCNDDSGGPCAVSDEAEATAMVKVVGRPCEAVQPIRKVLSSPHVSYFRYVAVKNR